MKRLSLVFPALLLFVGCGKVDKESHTNLDIAERCGRAASMYAEALELRVRLNTYEERTGLRGSWAANLVQAMIEAEKAPSTAYTYRAQACSHRKDLETADFSGVASRK